MKHLWIVLLLAVTGCQGIFDFSAQAVENKRLYNDAQAKIYLAVPCDMTVGASYRLLTIVQREGLRLWCDPDARVEE